MNQQISASLLSFLILASLTACTQHHGIMKIINPSQKFFGTQGQEGDTVRHQSNISASYASVKNCDAQQSSYVAHNYRADKPLQSHLSGGLFQTSNSPSKPNEMINRHAMFRGGLPLSPGDLVGLNIENGEGFNGDYVISSGGFLLLPHIEPLLVLGLPINMVRDKVELALVRAELFRAVTAQVRLKLLHWSDIEVSVTGAVFEPGRVRINRKIPQQLLEQRIQAVGDYSSERMLSEALRAASGIRPDAKLDQVILIRQGWQIEVDMSGIVTGAQVTDVPLVAGDQVVVPSTGCFQSHLVRPTQITPKGMRVFMSNLIDSAQDNSGAAIGRYSSNMPYGTKLLQGAVSANCVGGKQFTNAPRKVVLASRNPLTNQTQVIERSVEELMRLAHNEEINPYLMPNDAIACYDSDITNLRDIAKGLAEVIRPFRMF